MIYNKIILIPVFTPEELDTLHEKAIRFTKVNDRRFETIEWLYRNKTQEYFNKTYRQDAGIMKVYLKDHNGDPASIINDRIKGLFFATRIDPQTGSPPETSPFGSRRLYLPASEVLSDPRVRLYFADFYCTKKVHYVTIVLTLEGSEADTFCSENLIELETSDNDFLYTRYGNVYTRCRLHIEVLYTENINMAEWKWHGAWEETVNATGTSKPRGLPKNPSCTICNLDTSSTEDMDSL